MRRPTKLAYSLAVLLAGAGFARAQILLGIAQSLPSGAPARAIAPADLDGDGDLDLAVTTTQPEQLLVLENLGGGFYQLAQSFSLPAGSAPADVVAGDLDGDGDVDLALALSGADGVRLLLGQGAVQLVGGPTLAVPGGPSELSLADYDLDGDWDLVATCVTSGEVRTLRNQGGFVFAHTAVAVGTDLRGLGVAELTGDSLPDIAVVDAGSLSIRLLAGTGAGGFAAPVSLTFGTQMPQALALGDVDSDGDVDIAFTTVVAGFEYGRIALNEGGVFPGASLHPLNGLGAGSIALSDLDLDGDLDFVSANALSSNVTTYENDGSGKLAFFPSLWPTGFQPVQIVVADVDGVGGADVLTANAADLSLLRNVATGNPCALTTYCTPKPNSLGLDGRISATGLPALGPQGFSITLSSGVPGNVTIAFWGDVGPASVPFLGGTFCVQPPTTRLPPRVISAAGHASYAVEVTYALVGTTRWYQFWYRDPAHPDGTGVALSDALEVDFCD